MRAGDISRPGRRSTSRAGRVARRDPPISTSRVGKKRAAVGVKRGADASPPPRANCPPPAGDVPSVDGLPRGVPAVRVRSARSRAERIRGVRDDAAAAADDARLHDVHSGGGPCRKTGEAEEEITTAIILRSPQPPAGRPPPAPPPLPPGGISGAPADANAGAAYQTLTAEALRRYQQEGARRRISTPTATAPPTAATLTSSPSRAGATRAEDASSRGSPRSGWSGRSAAGSWRRRSSRRMATARRGWPRFRRRSSRITARRSRGRCC